MDQVVLCALCGLSINNRLVYWQHGSQAVLSGDSPQHRDVSSSALLPCARRAVVAQLEAPR